jgi:homoserine O-succinyltransferase
MFGVFPHKLDYKRSILFRGFDDVFSVPHSRHTTVPRQAIEAEPRLKILASSDVAGVYAVYCKDLRQIFIMGHSEYDALTLDAEYRRDIAKGMDIAVPCNYYPDDDPTKMPQVSWRSCANLLFSNWLNYFVYQTTPYDLKEIATGE